MLIYFKNSSTEFFIIFLNLNIKIAPVAQLDTRLQRCSTSGREQAWLRTRGCRFAPAIWRGALSDDRASPLRFRLFKLLKLHLWLNWIEHLASDQGVVGSSPTGCTILRIKLRMAGHFFTYVINWSGLSYEALREVGQGSSAG